MGDFVALNNMSASDSLVHWDAVMAYALTGEHVVITDNDNPLVVIIPYADFRALVSEFEDLHDARHLAALIEEQRHNPDRDPVWTRLITDLDEQADEELG